MMVTVLTISRWMLIIIVIVVVIVVAVLIGIVRCA